MHYMSMPLKELRARLAADYCIDEATAVARLLPGATLAPQAAARIDRRALSLAACVRAMPRNPWSAEEFLRQHGFSTAEGVALMCVAEALLRIPDPDTADALLREKLGSGRWGEAPEDASLTASAADWALMLTGTLARWADEPAEALAARIRRVVARLGEPLVRVAVRQAMRILAEQFVYAQTMDRAATRAAASRPRRHSFDMLGESARTAEDAARYQLAYESAIRAVAAHAQPGSVFERDSVSVKLSALHPRYEETQRSRVMRELLPRLVALATLARDGDVGLALDAEEADRLELQIDLLEQLANEPALRGWNGLGIAVQAYQRRAPALCDWLVALARHTGRRLVVRLVKGAYWDGEIKRTQLRGLADYPVYTRKCATDLCFAACARTLLAAPDAIYPAFATHNSRTVATVLELAGDAQFEFQRLHGMGESLYAALAGDRAVPSRLYAPVGSFDELLPYLVRRLLENGANTSFVHQLADPSVPLEQLIEDPLLRLPQPYLPNPRTPLPRRLYGDRENSSGPDLARREVLERLVARVAADRADAALAPANGDSGLREPGNQRYVAGIAAPATSPRQLDRVLSRASHAFEAWSRQPAAARAAVLERAAELIEGDMEPLVSILVREAGKTLADAVSEVREAADYCRYYALEARQRFADPLRLRGATGESNELAWHGRGVFACISPWNFPLAIFTGQVAAALAAGNSVVAKPAEQTPLCGERALALLHAAGIPPEAAIAVFGTGETVGAPLVQDERVAGVAFTGALDTAKAIQRALAGRAGAIVPLIAETGGVNAMLVDPSALPEQVVDDVVASAFLSAGQRCSALRVLFVNEACAPRVLRLIGGALAELRVGDPANGDTDVGPIIDAAARDALQRHVAMLRSSARWFGEARLPADLPDGHWLAPVAFELPLAALPRSEVFGPVLHACVYRGAELEQVLAWIRGTGYGLTLGIHSRVERFVRQVLDGTRVGNAYVNRSMTGAVVGVQPFGGEGLSGTGFKAGGPNYLLRFATERTVSINTAAVGGNAELLSGSS